MQPKTLKIDNVEYIRADSVPVQKTAGPEVLIRTYSAGVFIGTILERSGLEAKVLNARRLWSWQGAFTLNAVATAGVDRKNSRISKPVPEIILTQVIEIIPIAHDIDLSTTEK